MREREFEPNNASTPVVRGLIVFFGAQMGWRARQSIWGNRWGVLGWGCAIRLWIRL
jgi:hypothetical protein